MSQTIERLDQGAEGSNETSFAQVQAGVDAAVGAQTGNSAEQTGGG
jgi:hypothetical protein